MVITLTKYKWLLFELKSIDQVLYNTGLLLPMPKAKYSLGIFINLVLWQHIVDDDDDGNDDDGVDRQLVRMGYRFLMLALKRMMTIT